MSSLKRRGQAWIVYETVDEAANGMGALQGHILFGKKMRISYSKNMSDSVRGRRGLPARDKSARPVSEESAPKRQKTAPVDEFFRTAAPRAPGTTYNPPNRMLFVEGLPSTVLPDEIEFLFALSPGYIETRVVAARGVAFVEFDTDHSASVAMNKLQGKEMNGTKITINYARK